jgi:putrescine transport system permease protein
MIRPSDKPKFSINSLDLTNNQWRRLFVIGIPTVWLVCFLLLPFLFTLKMSVAETILASPPYTPLVTFEHHAVQIIIELNNYIFVLTHASIFLAFLSSVKIAFFTTLMCVLIGYPLAYAIANSAPRMQSVLFLMVILPYWTSFLLRAYAWIILLQNNGVVNQLLQKLGITHMPIRMIYNDFSVYLGLLYGYLPFFILPLYATLVKLDRDVLEAAYDLGCPPWRAFLKITLPLSWSGVVAGALLVFIPCVGEVVVPQILGGVNTLMIGNVIWQEFFIGNNWGVAAALAIVMLLLLVVPVVWLQRIQQKRALS